LKKNISFFKNLMSFRGFSTPSHLDTAIFLLEIGSIETARRFASTLLTEGVMAHEIIYPALPKNRAALRFTVTAGHSELQLEHAANAIEKVCRRMGLERLFDKSADAHFTEN
jgi:7-keto-8-aminopelargonate synthetase-like enzyme